MTSLMLSNSEQLVNSYLIATSGSGYLLHSSPPSTSQQGSPTTPNHHHQLAPKPHHQQQRTYHHLHQQQPHHHQQQDNSDLLRCKRRIQLGQLPAHPGKGAGGPQPAAVARRNERERNRVRLVNMGFATLRQHVPNSSKSKKMSKVDTLKSAVEYIKRLQELLGETGAGEGSSGADENSYPSLGGQSSTGSPTPSLCSEASSPYEVMPKEEEDELMEFASWF